MNIFAANMDVNDYACAMTNNNILKKIAIANNLKHFEMKEIFALGGSDFSSSHIKALMAGAKNKNYEKLSDEHFEGFLNGFIVYSRGPLADPTVLPRSIENHIITLVEAGNHDAIEEIRGLIEGVGDN
ncbi:MAG: DUF1456 family protein [Mariprofundaceae bacterium]